MANVAPAEHDRKAPPQVEFLICGSPNDAFYSQIAFFRASLDSLGGAWPSARVVAAFGDDEIRQLPERWKPHFERIEVHHADPDEYRREGFYAASNLRFTLADPQADLSCLCDADTAFISALPASLLDEARTAPAILGVPAHFPPPIGVSAGFPLEPGGPGPLNAPAVAGGRMDDEAWDAIGQAILGRPVSKTVRYSLLPDADEQRCPFYINYGFLAAPPALLGRLHDALMELHGPVAELAGNGFFGQIAIALAVERLGLEWRALPLRFNFPNDRRADQLHPDELTNVVLMHYLRTGRFDRHRIFSDERGFDDFMARSLIGSDRVFQDHVRRVTSGRYPFGEPNREVQSANGGKRSWRSRKSAQMDWRSFYAVHPLGFESSDHLQQVGHTVGGAPISDEEATLVLDDMEGLLSLAPGDVLLDLCCGNGLFTSRLAKNCDRVVGVDFSAPLVHIAERDHSAANITYYQMDALQVGSAGFTQPLGINKVVMNAALQHFTRSQLSQLLQDLIRITPEDRTFVFSLVPDKRRKWSFYDTSTKRRQHAQRVLTRRERMGKWWHPSEIRAICEPLGLSVSIHQPDSRLPMASYRFDARIT